MLTTRSVMCRYFNASRGGLGVIVSAGLWLFVLLLNGGGGGGRWVLLLLLLAVVGGEEGGKMEG